MSRSGLFRVDAKRDTAERPIIDALRALGYEVTQVSGKGAPDLLVRRGERLWAFEVKTGKAKYRGAAQAITQWPIIRTPEEAIEAIGAK